jgi:propanediol dehydratase large subunit
MSEVAAIDHSGRSAPAAADPIAVEDPRLGLVALHSPADPTPSLRIDNGVVVELDGRARADFDAIDAYIADHGIDLRAADQAMATPDAQIARLLLDQHVDRDRMVALIAGITPAKLAAVVREIRPGELPYALAKMRCRRSTAAQANVGNAADDPLLLAADAATAVAHGFREIGARTAVSANAASNAVAVLIGCQVATPGALTRCADDSERDLALGVRGLIGYTESVPLTGSEDLMLDDGDTPWSLAFLVAAHASRGVKVRTTSGGGSETARGAAQGRSMLYLQARCVSLARACGSQGVHNGGTHCADLVAGVPEGMLALQYENLMALLRGLECVPAADTRAAADPGRRLSRHLPAILAESDWVIGGFSAVREADGLTAANLTLNDLDELLLVQRDWGVDAGLRSTDPDQIAGLRQRAAGACAAAYSWLGLADFDDDHVQAVATGAAGLPDLALTVLSASRTISQQAVTALDVACALDESGYEDEAERLMALIRARLRGDQLQPAAYFDQTLTCRSQISEPNDYTGPGTGPPRPSAHRDEVSSVPGQLSIADVRAAQDRESIPGVIDSLGPAAALDDPRDVVVAVSPAFGRGIWATLSGLSIVDVLDEVLSGLEEEGCSGRVVRVTASADLGRISAAGAALAGSPVGRRTHPARRDRFRNSGFGTQLPAGRGERGPACQGCTATPVAFPPSGSAIGRVSDARRLLRRTGNRTAGARCAPRAPGGAA